MSERSDALAQVAALARQHGLSAAEIAAALGEQPATTAPADGPGRATLVQVLGYLGGTFVFAGIGVFVALQWNDINSFARVVVTLGSGLAAYILAILAAREERFEKATTPLILIAAALEPAGMLVAFSEFGSGGDWRWAGVITAGVMAVQFGMTFAGLRRSTPLFLTLIFTILFWWTALDLAGMDEDVVALCMGGSIMLATIGIDRSAHRDITPLFYLLGSIAFLYGLFDVLKNTALEIGFLAAAAGFVSLAAVVHSRTVLFVSTLAILAYTGYYTGQHFANSLGWPLALIGFGIFMIGLSAVAVRIDRDYIRRAT